MPRTYGCKSHDLVVTANSSLSVFEILGILAIRPIRRAKSMPRSYTHDAFQSLSSHTAWACVTIERHSGRSLVKVQDRNPTVGLHPPK